MVSDENKKILKRILNEHGRLSSNEFFHIAEKNMSKQTFHNTLGELVEEKTLVKEPVVKPGDKTKWVYYSIP